MNPKNTWLLVALAAGIFAFIFFVERRIPHVQPASTRVVGGLNPAGVTVVQIQPAGHLEIIVERGEGQWLMTKPVNYPARSEAVEGLVGAIAGLEHRVHLTAQDLKTHHGFSAEYGLDNPQVLITLTDAGEQHLLKIGGFTAPGDQLYAEVVGEDGVDIIDADFFKKFVPRDANDWRERLFLPPFKAADFDTLTVASGQRQFILRRDSTNAPWQMTSPVQSRTDSPRINDLLETLKTLRVVAFVTDDARADLDAYGLQQPSLELKFDHGTNHLASLQFGKTAGTNTDLVYSRRNGQASVVTLARETVAAWEAGFQDFRDSHLARIDGSLLRRIDVENGGGPGFYVLREGLSGEWTAHSGEQAIPVTTNSMNDFISAITNLQVARINGQMDVRDAVATDTNSLAEFGLVKPARRIVLRGASDYSSTEPATNIFAELDFGLVKDARIFVRRADRPAETSVYGVAVADYSALPESLLQLHDKRVWDFSAEDVSRLIISHGGGTREILHKGENKWSLAPGSQGMINDLQIQVGVQELGLLEAAAWIERGDADRASFGFSTNSTSIAVVLPAKAPAPERKLIMELGGLSPRGLRYGITTLSDGSKWIFEIQSDIMDRLMTYFSLPDNPTP